MGQSAVGKRKQPKILLYRGINHDRPGGELPEAGRRGKHRVDIRDALGLTNTLVVAEDERSFLYDRPSRPRPKLIAPEGWNASGVKIVPCIECAIAQKFVSATVKLVRSGTGNGVDHAAGAFSVLSRIVARENGKLLNGIHA